MNNKQKTKNREKGFTLIELLIVIVIIGVLASLLMANFVGVRQRGRDAQRKSDLRQIQAALELYKADEGVYPDNTTLDLSKCGESFQSGNGTLYMQKIPCDPTNASTFTYSYNTTNQSTYTLKACLENPNDSQGDNPNDGSCGSGSVPTTLQNP